MRIVIIGGNHFPAVNILLDIAERNPASQIFILDNNPNDLPLELKENPQIFFWQGTAKDKILLKNLLSNAQVLINMAEADNIEDYISSVSNILEFAKDSNLERIIHLSSSRVYGDIEDSPVTEEHPTKPTDLKGVTETMGEQLAYYYSSKYSLPVVILRTFNLYGPYQPIKNTIPSLITTALKNESLQLWGDGEQTENLLFVEDLIEAIQKILKAKFDSLRGEVINIGNLGATPIKEIASTILLKLNKPQNLITYEKNNKQDSFLLVPSIMKAKILLSWSPKVEIEEGLDKTISWYINNRDLWDTSI